MESFGMILDDSRTWRIERHWVVLTENSEPTEHSTIELSNFHGLALLGAAGMGKTIEARQLAEYERSVGRTVRECRLAEYSGTSSELAAHLKKLSEGVGPETSIYLDALDEAMIPLRSAALGVARWIRDDINGTGSRLRITCRSAVWPDHLSAEMQNCYGEEHQAKALLQALTNDDIVVAASSYGIDGSAFLDQVRSARAELLAQQPLTLKMLLRIFERGGGLPSTLSELFANGVRELATDRHERFALGTELGLSPDDLLAAAERLACYLVFTGRETVDLRDEPASGALPWSDLAGLADGGPALNRDTLMAVGSSGLCDSTSPSCFGFAHRQFAEYLAARRLAKLLPHQARSLLGSPAGWQAGVAGPLRETAAFTAILSPAVATWIARYDPEVVGLSDVADQDLRRTATLGLLERFRRREITDAQVGGGELELRGFQYDDAETDLRYVLREQGEGCDDVLECAIELIDSWQLSAMSDDLADLMLDPTAPLHPRKAAGYALGKFGTVAAREKIKPLFAGSPEDENDDLKGLALRYNWPDRVTVSDLLDALGPPRTTSYHGAYDGFLLELDREAFNAEGGRIQGLKWATQNLNSRGGTSARHRIAVRIVHAAIRELDDSEIADALIDLLFYCASIHVDSPLGPLGKTGYDIGHDEVELSAPLQHEKVIRRLLVDKIVTKTAEPETIWSLALQTPSLGSLDDFEWLLERATDVSKPLVIRRNYIEIARTLPWFQNRRCVRAWRRLRNREPVSPTLDGRVARTPVEWANMRWRRWRHHASELHRKWKHRPKRVRPSPARRITMALKRAERKDPRFFFNVCEELTLEAKSTHYGYERFLIRSSGWARARPRTRARIVKAAKSLLSSDIYDPAECRKAPLNSIRTGYIAAIWLLMETNRGWLEKRDSQWWRRWCWCILRDLHPNMHNEPEEPKTELLLLLHHHAPASVRQEIIQLASSDEDGAKSLLSDLLRLLDGTDDPELDNRLCRAIAAGTVRPDRLGTVAQFVLHRWPNDAIPACMALLDLDGPDSDESPAVQAAVSLLYEQPSAAWERVADFIQTKSNLGRRVLALFAHGERFRIRSGKSSKPLDALSAAQLGKLAGLLIELFPPESDPRHDGAYSVGPDDSARDLRNRLISGLGDRADAEAVSALRELEQRFGTGYPWLRRPRARAERSHRLSQWHPMPLGVIADLLASGEKRLIRSAEDVLEGIEAALHSYEESLRQEGANDVQDLWNTPRGGQPSPKAEEQVSTKLCGAVRSYFADYAIAADREVEIHRRAVSQRAGGEPGSELDVLVQIPARGTRGAQSIRIPIEVKLSCNNEAKTGMKDQLVDRYMPQLGTSHGVYVVVWMDVPDRTNLQPHHRPRWPDIAAAKAELEAQADSLKEESGAMVATILIDATLR